MAAGPLEVGEKVAGPSLEPGPGSRQGTGSLGSLAKGFGAHVQRGGKGHAKETAGIAGTSDQPSDCARFEYEHECEDPKDGELCLRLREVRV